MSLLDIIEERPMRGGSDAAPLLVVKLAGQPIGKGRPRSRIVSPPGRPPFITVYTDAETRKYEDALRAAAIDAMAGRPILDGYLEVILFAYFTIPESWSEKKREAARIGLIRPDVKPDFDNIAKTLDALSPYRDPRTKIKVPVAWRDDAIIVDARQVKIYARRKPGIIIEVRRAGPPPLPWDSTYPTGG